jgi:hypothetical protein
MKTMDHDAARPPAPWAWWAESPKRWAGWTETPGRFRRNTQPPMGTAFKPATTSPASWDAFSDVDAFVDAVLAELAVLAGTRSTRSGPKPPLTGSALRKAIMAIWCVTFYGMQWRAIGLLCDIPFGTLYTLFARGPGLACGAGCSTA